MVDHRRLWELNRHSAPLIFDISPHGLSPKVRPSTSALIRYLVSLSYPRTRLYIHMIASFVAMHISRHTDDIAPMSSTTSTLMHPTDAMSFHACGSPNSVSEHISVDGSLPFLCLIIARSVPHGFTSYAFRYYDTVRSSHSMAAHYAYKSSGPNQKHLEPKWLRMVIHKYDHVII